MPYLCQCRYSQHWGFCPLPIYHLSLTYQSKIGDRSWISQPTISRMIPAVLAAIKSLFLQYIKFMYSDGQQTGLLGFPYVIGVIVTMCIYEWLSIHQSYKLSFYKCSSHLWCQAISPKLGGLVAWGTHDSFILQNISGGTQLQEGALQNQSHFLND